MIFCTCFVLILKVLFLFFLVFIVNYMKYNNNLIKYKTEKYKLKNYIACNNGIF
ncbi:uncharacterized protein METZ01_LOCUS45008 [marine metagenome]|uniref:Uncharacterized protein n=1 Tax=marine metagenome TaxID=408172 RepID=A0A381RLQ2_9ZZZZ